jgi:hypothetical protein
MMGRLMQCSEMFEMQRMKDEHDERERDERERIKREQDQAYRESLEFDKAKRQRHAEEEEIKKKEKEIEHLEKRKLLENIETRKSDALKRLPNEPDINQTNVFNIIPKFARLTAQFDEIIFLFYTKQNKKGCKDSFSIAEWRNLATAVHRKR